MLGEAHMPKRRLFPLAAIALAVLAAPGVGGADSAPHAAAALHAQSSKLAARSRAAVLELYALDQQLGTTQRRLAGLRLQRATLRAERASLLRQRAVGRRSTRIAQARLGKRLRLLYEQGTVEPLEIVLGARSLDDAVSSLDSLTRAGAEDEAVVRELRTARKALDAASAAMASRARALAAATLQARATARALEQGRSARAAYIAALTVRRRLNEAQIASTIDRARAAQVRSLRLSPPPTRTVTVAAPSHAGRTPVQGRTITVSSTGYSLGGTTSTGLPTGWGVAAVDPSVIPLGTHMTVPGYGEAVAADTGGSIAGATIDLWFPSRAQAGAWGRRTVTVVLH
ncbi:MAG: 3D domain-containing protein [Gaiellaceae bacterium]